MIILSITIENIAQELHFRVEIKGFTEHFSDTSAMMPNLIVLFHIETALLKPFHLVLQRKSELTDELSSVEPGRIVTITDIDHFLCQLEGALAYLLLF